MRTNIDLSTIPVGVLIGLGAVLLLEIALDVAALVDLYRRPVATVALGNKWIWVALIVLINLIGPILYFAIGRKPAATVDMPAPESIRSQAEIVDSLYGQADEASQP